MTSMPEDSRNLPRVFIAMATTILGGPGKGLAQFLRHGGLEGCAPLMAAYNTQPEPVDTEYTRALRAAGAPVAELRQRKLLDYSLVGQALEMVRRHKSDILQSHGYKSHILCRLLRARTGLPWIAFVHGWTAEDRKIRVYNALEHLMLPRADQVVAVSEALKARLLPSARAKCIVIPNAVEEDGLHEGPSGGDVRAALGIAPQALVAGVVGRLSPEKGQIHFLRALAEARGREPRLHGLLVGGGPDRERLEAEARTLGVGDRCCFTGHVRGLGPYYRAMDVQVLPSLSEGMPNAALEGMIMGKPLVASRAGGVPEVVEDGVTGLLLPPGDAHALAEALLALAADPVRRKSMGEAGRDRAATRFSPGARARRILELYADVLERHSRKGARP